MDLILATNNDDKIREMSALLSNLDIKLKTRKDFKDFPDIAETGTTLIENAKLKAQGIYQAFGLPSLADDSGLEVDALNGAPGVYSARYSGEDATYKSNCIKLLDELKGVPTAKRSARFRCVIAIAWGPEPDSIEIADGTVEGLITEILAGEAGFGYDPVFYHQSSKKTFAEMASQEKNQISHRGIALQKARELISKHLLKSR